MHTEDIIGLINKELVIKILHIINEEVEKLVSEEELNKVKAFQRRELVDRLTQRIKNDLN